MATATFLSQHSSNPLEVSSSDARNKAYRRQLMRAKKQQKDEGDCISSSDDPLMGCNVPDLEQYHSHIAQLYPNTRRPFTATRPQDSSVHQEFNEDMFSEDELIALPAEPLNDYCLGDEDVESEIDGDILDEQGGHVETDEELTIHLKAREEQEEIEEEIADLETTVPQLTPDYKIVDRLGTGTFSSVYKAIDLGYHDRWDNAPWQGYRSPSASYQSLSRPPGSKVFVAVKRIYVTSGPERIRNEISIMEDCRGCRHISQLITAFRQHDQVVAIMPYHRNIDFREYYRVLPMDGIKAYFRCMFRALRDVHARAIIHRDVKPANFLFDPRTGIGTLCDFGLACRVERGPTLGACLHTGPTPDYPHGRIRPRAEFDVDHVKRMQKEGRLKSSLPSERVGYLEKDTRPISKANRAGTRGFRAPEVLLKCGEQTGAIDVWSAGMILLFFLTRKFPLFHSSDDVEALMEIASIIGKKRMEKTATLHSRVFQTNVPSVTPEGMTWREFVEQQNPDLRTPPEPDPRFYPHTGFLRHQAGPPPSSSPQSRYSPSRSSPPPASLAAIDTEAYAADVEKALDFVERVMHPEATQRITPKQALAHAFLHDLDEPDDDEFFPHPYAEGVCGDLHFIDEDTDELCVRVRVPGENQLTVRRVSAGEGTAIGRQPCEFHRKEDGYVFSS
ncbi:kinase-like protein [Daedalea quercina L-15889]|uniref:non-specific serine/threonine protein kinase n=1 Tax=Daedalea quercina L-15889 TaxID=1314783 RepID=A0A165R5V8_9APHY|nr:kinase-like protein [Daedalea quercina L-15889]